MRKLGLALLLLVPTVVAIGLVWWTDWPLGVAGEWTWTRAMPLPPVALSFLSLSVTGAAYVAVVWLGANRVAGCGRVERGAWLFGLAMAGFGWLWIAQESAPEGFQLSKSAWVLYFPGPSGYFTEARSDRRPFAEFLRDYERRMSEGDVLHIGTHPPGLIVVFRGLLSLCRKFPRLTDALVASEPDSVRESLDVIADTARAGTAALNRVDRAVLWLAGLLSQSLAALTVIPLYGLLRRTSAPAASWQSAALWPAVPAVAVFLPKSDAFFPCLTALVLWLWLTGFERGLRIRCALAGLALWFALCLSLAFLPVALLAAIASAWSWWARPLEIGLGERGTGTGDPKADERTAGPVAQTPAPRLVRTSADPPSGVLRTGSRSYLIAITLAAGGFVLPIISLRLIYGINLLVVWWINLRNHAGFYSQFTRTYWKWLFVNPIEFAFALGLPLAVLSLLSATRTWRLRQWTRLAPVVAFAATWAILWLSGKNMGEAARLWIFLAPCAIWISAPLFERADPAPRAPTRERTPILDLWSFALASQLLVSAAIVTRVVGFQQG